MNHPRVVIAATASGQGKTTVAVGLMAALRRQGHSVAGFKVGPDYIDPGYHALATSRPGRNLDPFLTSPRLINPLLLNGFHDADVGVIEGVMGLFDGRLGSDGFASTAHVASLTDSPVLLVVDISSASRTVGAIVRGLADHDPDVRIGGVILNKSGSPRHAQEARRAVEQVGVPVLGVLPRDAGVSAPSRHLGLVPAAERTDAVAALDRLAEQIAEHIDLPAVLRLAESAGPVPGAPWSPTPSVEPISTPLVEPTEALAEGVSKPGADTAQRTRPVIAIAGGRAFTFRYAETTELLEAAGCEAVIFDPAIDATLPPNTRGLYLGGGFPESHVSDLAANTTLLAQVREEIANGLPTVAECAGLLYLADSLDGHPMVGALPTTAAMHPRLTLGYRTATIATDSILGPAGTPVTAHEFHRTATEPAAGEQPAWEIDGRPEGFALDPADTGRATVVASYLHLHWAGHPQLAANFARAAAAYGPHPLAVHRVSTRPPLALRSAQPTGSWSTPPTGDNHHGDDDIRDRPDLIDLAVNVRVPQPPRWLAELLRAGVDDLAAYPDQRAARKATADRHGLPEDMVLLTAGGAEAFALIARAIQGRRPLVVHPQFSEPDAALRAVGRRAEHHLLQPSDGFRLDPTIVDPAADLVFVGNPTNPTGVLHPRPALDDLRRAGRVVVIDEAFYDCLPSEQESMIKPEMADVLVIRSLTKTWGVAGLRAGYVIGDPQLLRQLSQAQPHWPVSTPALAVATATTARIARAEARALASEAAKNRAHLTSRLEAVGLRPVPGAAPFVLVKVGAGVREALRDNGFVVRRCDTFPGLSDAWIRIAVRDRPTTDALVAALTPLLARKAVTA
ncbi:cobyrinate a,c-diamide synthase [Calidifontibacter terrae]